MIKNIHYREVIYEILNKFFLEKKSVNKMLINLDKHYLLMEKDKKKVIKIVYGTIKNKELLNFIVDKYTNSKNQKIRILLYLTIYQIYCVEEITKNISIEEAILIAKNQKIQNIKLIKTILNTIIQIDNINKHLQNSKLNKLDKFLLKYSFPKVIYLYLKRSMNEEDLKKFVIDNINISKISYRVNISKIDYNHFVKYFSNRFNFIKSKISKNGINCFYFLNNTSFYQNKYIVLHNEISQFIIEKLNPNKNEFILSINGSTSGVDTNYISSLMKNTGKIDIFIKKRHNKKLMFNVEKNGTWNSNFYSFNKIFKFNPNFFYDKIIIKAKTLELGLIKRKPEIKYEEFSDNKIKILIKNQFVLLCKAYELLKDKGEILYYSYTIDYEENERQIEKIIKKFPNLRLINQKKYFGYESNSDGFYYCKLLKN